MKKRVNREELCDKWIAQFFPTADGKLKEILKCAYDRAYFQGWDEGETQANDY